MSKTPEEREAELAREREYRELAPVSINDTIGAVLRKFARSIELQAKAQRGYADQAGEKGEVFKIQAMHFDDIAKEMRQMAERTENAGAENNLEEAALAAAVGEFTRIALAPGNESMQTADIVVLLGVGLMPAIRAYNRVKENAGA